MTPLLIGDSQPWGKWEEDGLQGKLFILVSLPPDGEPVASTLLRRFLKFHSPGVMAFLALLQLARERADSHLQAAS